MLYTFCEYDTLLYGTENRENIFKNHPRYDFLYHDKMYRNILWAHAPEGGGGSLHAARAEARARAR